MLAHLDALARAISMTLEGAVVADDAERRRRDDEWIADAARVAARPPIDATGPPPAPQAVRGPPVLMSAECNMSTGDTRWMTGVTY